jgi:hypothetical protein
MRRLVIVIALVLLPSATAFAQTKPYATPHAPRPGEANSDDPWQPPPKPTEAQMQAEMNAQTRTGRSGFWTSPYPAQHGAYRYRLLILGIGIAGIMGFTAWRLVKRTQPPQRR